ncbi:T9SS type A sorting domain-containing protein, partial [bacterium]|nr:T9SS type A sorting domain-containing protein [bacterium]
SVSWQIYIPDSARPEISEFIYYTLYASAETLGEAGTLEVTTTIVAGSIWVPGATYIGPTADIAYPDSGTFTSNAIQPLAIYITDDDTTVAPYSIHWQFLNAIGEVISDLHPGIAGITYENDTLYWENVSHSDGSVLWYRLTPTYDYHGCPLQDTVNCRFTYDLSAPIIRGYYPPDDTIINDSLFDAYVYFRDNISRRIDTMLVRVTITDDECTHTDSFPDGPLAWSPAEDTMLWIDPEVSGWRWPDGDITISLDQLCDAPDYGEPNCTDESELPEWSFTMNAHGPRAHPIAPGDGWFVAIPNPDITFYLYDGNGINVSTVQYQVDGEVFGAPSDFHTGDSIIVHSPAVSWDNGYAVDVAVIAAEDTLGTPLDPPEYHYPAWEFVIDLTPPVITGTDPADGDTVGTEYPTIEINLYDSLSGVDVDSITIEVAGIEYTIDDDAVDYTGGILSWDAEIAGISLSGDVEVCVNACDSPDMGDANWMDEYCFNFSAVVEPPTVEFPFSGTSICSDDAQLDVYIYDRDGVDESSIVVSVDGTEYTTDDDELEYDGTYNIVSFYPPTPWLAGDYITICVDSAADYYGYALAEPVCSTFVVDLSPPVIDSVGEDVFSTWEPPDTAELDSVVFHFYFTNELGIVDSNNASLYIYDSSGTSLLWEFDYPDSSANFWFGDGEVIFWSGSTVEFEDFETYHICLFLDDACYAGGHDPDSATYCFDYYATKISEGQKIAPKPTMLLPNYPDPFNAATIIPVYMSERGFADVKIIDIGGRTIATLWNGSMNYGITELRWNGTDNSGADVPSGIYFVRLQTRDGVQVSRACLIR